MRRFLRRCDFVVFWASWILQAPLIAAGSLAGAPATNDAAVTSTLTTTTAALSPETTGTAAWSISGNVPPLKSAAAASDPAAKHFIRTCAGCHTVGRGILTGPDLKPTSGWPETDRMNAIKRMEKQVGPLEPAQIKELAALLGDERAQERIADEEKLEAQAMIAKMDKPSADKGRKLYLGQMALENGGSACIACHSTSNLGGNLAIDLTHVYTKMGEAALLSAVEQGSFKVMNAAYRDHKITKQEAMHLTAFFKETDQNPPQFRGSVAVPLSGIGGAVVLLGMMVFGHRKRNGANRAALTRRR